MADGMTTALAIHRSDVENLYTYVAQSPQGVTKAELQANGYTDVSKLMNVANKLLADGHLELLQIGGGELLFRATNPHSANKCRNLDHSHMLIYQLIEKTGDKGAWIKNLKDQSNLQQHAVGRITKELIKRQLIKEVKSVANRGRKVYMLWDIEPAREVSGGSWYHDGEFATEWVEELRERCQALLEQRFGQPVTLQDLHQFVLEQPGPSVPSEEDIHAIMRTLELDEEVDVVRDPNGRTLYLSRQRAGSSPFNIFAARLPSYMVKSRVEFEQPQRWGLVTMERPWTAGRGSIAGASEAVGETNEGSW